MSSLSFALMQPYFLPYIGYWQLLNEVETLVISNDTKYIKQSWINRNRIILNNRVVYITIPLKSASDYALIKERTIATDFDVKSQLQKICHSYGINEIDHRKKLLETILSNESRALDKFLLQSITELCKYLKITCNIIMASDIEIPSNLRKEERIYFVGDSLGSNQYFNLPGGRQLYNKEKFEDNGFSLNFINPNLIPYEQNIDIFIPYLSIMDLILSVDNQEVIANHLYSYTVD